MKQSSLFSTVMINGLLVMLCIAWTLPTFGVFLTSFRHRNDIDTSGWWTILKDPLHPNFTLNNYRQVMAKQGYQAVIDGEEIKASGDDVGRAFLNSLTVTIPSVVMPILIAAFAAYGFAWIDFRGRQFFFTIVIALLVVPLQISLIPIMRDYTALKLTGTYLAVWLAHTGFGLPMAIYLLFTYISQLPKDIFESAFIDGASHFTIFVYLIFPLSMPALAAFAIFQFLWVWNDLLVAIVFLGTNQTVAVLTQALLNMIGSRGENWYLLTSGAFISMALPLIVFLSLQRYFVSGLLTGSVKG